MRGREESRGPPGKIVMALLFMRQVTEGEGVKRKGGEGSGRMEKGGEGRGGDGGFSLGRVEFKTSTVLSETHSRCFRTKINPLTTMLVR